MNNEFICSPGSDTFEVLDASLSNGSDFWYEGTSLMGRSSDSGVRVNGYTALTNCAVWQAVNILSGDVGQLPIKLYQKQGEKRNEVNGVPAIEIWRQPNAWQLPSVWKETMMSWALVWGNSLSWIRTDNAGQPSQLVPLRPDRVGFEFEDELRGEFYYTYKTLAGNTIPFDSHEIFHIQGLASDGLWGYPLVEVAKNCIGHGLALERFSNRTFANGARPGGIVKHPGKPSPEARANFRREWNEIHQGVDNASKVALLAEGMDFVNNQLDMEAAQLEGLRRLDREMVASLFNLPAFKLNSLEHSSVRANLEEQNRDYFNTSLSRWLNRFAEEGRRKLMTEQQRRGGFYYRWVPEAFLKGDIAARYNAYGVAITNRIMNPNEARELEDMNPYDGGDEYGNPNIDPKISPDNKAENTPKEPPKSRADGRPNGSDSADRLIEDRLRQVIKAESNHVHRAAKDSKLFVNWIEKYYAAGGGFWTLVDDILRPLATEVLQILAGYKFSTDDWAACYAAESKRRLLKVCDQVTQDHLVDTVKEECATWGARAVR